MASDLDLVECKDWSLFHKAAPRRKTISPYWLLALLLVALCFGLFGCAAQSPASVTTNVCYMRLMGQTEEGYSVVLQACQSPESFRESQK